MGAAVFRGVPGAGALARGLGSPRPSSAVRPPVLAESRRRHGSPPQTVQQLPADADSDRGRLRPSRQVRLSTNRRPAPCVRSALIAVVTSFARSGALAHVACRERASAAPSSTTISAPAKKCDGAGYPVTSRRKWWTILDLNQ